LLLDDAGRCARGSEIDLGAVEPERFAMWLSDILHSSGRLEQRAAAIRAELPQRVADALKRLETVEDHDVVLRDAANIVPLLVYERLLATGHRRASIEVILQDYIGASDPVRPGPRLPYGVVAGFGRRGGCGGRRCEEEGADAQLTVVACGMGAVRQGRYFIRFAAR
jgi:hypothetical protein